MYIGESFRAGEYGRQETIRWVFKDQGGLRAQRGGSDFDRVPAARGCSLLFLIIITKKARFIKITNAILENSNTSRERKVISTSSANREGR